VAIMWLIWQYRAHANLRVAVAGTRWPPLLAVATWFIPVVNLVGPPLAMRELWRASHPDREDWRNTWTTPLLWLWWLLLVSSAGLTVWALAPAWHDSATLRELFVRDHRAVIAAGVGIPTALTTAILMVRINGRVTLREDLAHVGKWRGWTEGRARRR